MTGQLSLRIKEILRTMPVLLQIFAFPFLSGQTPQYDYFYRVCFIDKGNNDPSLYVPSALLSEKAIERRINAEIDILDFRDIPVNHDYLDELRSLGLILHTTSRWMNTGLFRSSVPIDPARILALPCVKDVKTVKYPPAKNESADKLYFKLEQDDPSAYDRPVAMLNGSLLHNSGLNGNGVLIAVLDAGFENSNKVSSLQHLMARNGIKATYDFISSNSNVYGYHDHGTAVLSVLAGLQEERIAGSAPGADFLLLRTEDNTSEFPVEEDFWVAGAEYADSSGADIISSSLGYYNFDDPLNNYLFHDLDGDRAFVTVAADIAASKGILVVSSAGNERNKEWKRIIAPSDGDSVIAVGAVDANKVISSFSSAGPAADGRVKPDVVAMGVSIPVQTQVSVTSRSNGTSFSCPVISGLAACLIQAVPFVRNTEITEALQRSADRYTTPDSLYGFGVPDILKALEWLQELRTEKPEQGSLAWPNPTRGNLEIIFSEPPGSVNIEVYNSTGRIFYKKEYREYAGRTLPVQILQNMKGGIYYFRIRTGTGTFTHKIIRMAE